jgi:hypothetical protein
MRKIIIMCGAIFISILFTQAVAQDNNQSIGEDLKKVWGDPGAPSGAGMDMDGMYDTPVETNSTTFTDDVADAPIDGGIGMLLAAGLGYGVKRLRRKANEKNAYRKND